MDYWKILKAFPYLQKIKNDENNLLEYQWYTSNY